MNIFRRRSSDLDKRENSDISSDEDFVNELIFQCISGRDNCCKELYLRYAEMIAKYFRKRFNYDEELVRELTQTTFERAFNKLKNWRKESKFSTWVFRIAINLGKDNISWKNREPQHVSIHADDTNHLENEASLAAPPDSPEKLYQKKELKEVIDLVVGRLPEKEGIVISLRFGDDEPSIADISHITGFSVGKTCNLIKSGLKRMSKMKEIQELKSWQG